MVLFKNKKSAAQNSMVDPVTPGTLISDVALKAILAVIMFCCFIPLWHVLMCSLSDGKLLMQHEGILWWPLGDGINFGGYKLLFKNQNILRGYLNTLLYVVGTVALGVVCNVLGGYALSRKTKLKGVLTIFVLLPMMFTGGMAPTYLVVKTLGLTGTPLALLLPACANPIFIILMSNAFSTVPESTVEAARIDGAGHLRVMFQIMLPQCMGMLLVTIINTAIITWNSWFEASIYLVDNNEWWPLQLWIRQTVANNQEFLRFPNPDYNRYLIQYAVIVVSTLPVLVAFPFFQKRLEKGMVQGAVKE